MYASLTCAATGRGRNLGLPISDVGGSDEAAGPAIIDRLWRARALREVSAVGVPITPSD